MSIEYFHERGTFQRDPKNGSYVLQKVRETDYRIHRIKNWIYELQKLTVTQN